MDFNLIDLIFYLDIYLVMLVSNYGVWIYVILFLVIFCEIGLVVILFFFGDLLLFIVGVICVIGGMDLWLFGGLLMVVVIIGDSINYVIGWIFGKWLFSNFDLKVFCCDYFDCIYEFYECYGGKIVILVCFLFIVWIFVFFVVGMVKMYYLCFVMFSVVGIVVWVGGLVILGYFFGNVLFIKKNLLLLVIGIILLLLLLMIFGFICYCLQVSVVKQVKVQSD